MTTLWFKIVIKKVFNINVKLGLCAVKRLIIGEYLIIIVGWVGAYNPILRFFSAESYVENNPRLNRVKMYI